MKIEQKKIDEWKAKHGDLYQISVEGKSCLLRRPTRKDISYASVVRDPMQLSETMLKQLWLDGDREILEQDDLFLAVVAKMEEVMKIKEAEIKKI
ncbi:MAG: hypothetical protein II844_03680 [Prevotella sp.]|jgi:hypothetical protein|nr:hypothetical protein [Prevotella sp.]